MSMLRLQNQNTNYCLIMIFKIRKARKSGFKLKTDYKDVLETQMDDITDQRADFHSIN